MRDKVFLDTQGIINWVPENRSGDIDGTETALTVIESLLSDESQKCILVDLTKTQRPTAEQRKAIIERLQRNAQRISRIALYGHSPMMKAIAYFIINTSQYDSLHFFSNRSEAIRWLKQV